MLTNKKIMLVATTDNMIWQFLLPHIKHLQELGNQVECVCHKTGFWFDELQEKYGLKLHNIPFARNPIKPTNLKAYKQLKKLQEKEKFDIIYSQQPVGGLMGRLIAKKYKIPCIYTAHGFHFYKGCPLANKLIFKTVEKYCSKFTDVLITINEEDYQNALKFKAKKVYKINGIGVDLSKYKPNKDLNRAEFKKSLGLEKDDFVITSIGELNENKNTLRLIEVIKNIDNPKIKYLVCGQGPLQENFEELIAKYNLSDRVKMLGFRKDIPDILTITDVYIMPSYREGLSKSMMEAMCYGLPVVASKIRGNVDLVGDNEGGILCEVTNNEDYKNAILKLYEDKDLMKSINKRNKEYIKYFDIKVVLNQMQEIYSGINILK